MTKNRGGRPEIVLTDGQIVEIEELSAHLTTGQIADYYGIDDHNESFYYRPSYTIALLNGLDKFPGADKEYDELSND